MRLQILSWQGLAGFESTLKSPEYPINFMTLLVLFGYFFDFPQQLRIVVTNCEFESHALCRSSRQRLCHGLGKGSR